MKPCAPPLQQSEAGAVEAAAVEAATACDRRPEFLGSSILAGKADSAVSEIKPERERERERESEIPLKDASILSAPIKLYRAPD
jgi:hypothetical protein